MKSLSIVNYLYSSKGFAFQHNIKIKIYVIWYTPKESQKYYKFSNPNM